MSDGLVATKSLKPGDVILQEEPLVWGPGFNSVPICVGCGDKFSGNYKECVTCGFLVCCEICEKSPQHIPECRYVSQRGQKVKIQNLNQPNPLYNCVTILRCLYQKQFLPKKFKKIAKLNRNETSQQLTIQAEFLRRFFKLFVFSVDEISKIIGIIKFNSFQINHDGSCIALYRFSSFLQHNCRANCQYFIRSGRIILRAVTDIFEGQILSVCYVDSLLPTPTRRQVIYDLKSIWCLCSRCQDPTELGTNFSAFKCQQKNCNGVVLPKTFTNSKEIPDWICNQCCSLISSYLAYDLLERIERDFQDLDKSKLENCQVFWDNYKSVLDENHFYFFQIKLFLCEIFNDLTQEDLQLKITCCENLESLVRVLAPGEWRILTKILYQKYQTLQELNKRKSLEMNSDLLLEIMEILKDIPEDEIYQKASRELKH